SEGTRWTRCGHFQRHMIIAIVDCNSYRCALSHFHPPECRSPLCRCVYGEELQQDVDSVNDYCWQCKSAQERAARQK
ncbi:hypothetical protein FPV67DRAFT_1409373, partial [Lyophyllum atratum]